MKCPLSTLSFWLLPLFLFAQEYEQTVFLGDTCWLLPDSISYVDYGRKGHVGAKKRATKIPDGLWLAVKDHSASKAKLRTAIEQGVLVIDSIKLAEMEAEVNVDFFRFQIQNNLLEGPFSRYDERQHLRESGYYQEGRKTGVWQVYNRKGGLVHRGVYLERLGEYKSEVFYDNGQLKYRQTIIGELGPQKLSLSWYENGQLKEMGLWQRNSKPSESKPYEKWGEWIYYYANGFMKKVERYRNGSLHDWVYLYDENGQRFGADLYKKGVLKVEERYLLPERDGVEDYEVIVTKIKRKK